MIPVSNGWFTCIVEWDSEATGKNTSFPQVIPGILLKYSKYCLCVWLLRKNNTEEGTIAKISWQQQNRWLLDTWLCYIERMTLSCEWDTLESTPRNGVPYATEHSKGATNRWTRYRWEAEVVQLGIQEDQLRVLVKKQVFRSRIMISYPTQPVYTSLLFHYKPEVCPRDNLL